MKQVVPVLTGAADKGERLVTEVDVKNLGLLAGANILALSEASIILTDEHHGLILDLLNSSAITVTAPPGLRGDFYCGLSQGGTGQVTVAAGGGATLVNADGQFKTEKRYVMLSLIAFGPTQYRLFGRTAA